MMPRATAFPSFTDQDSGRTVLELTTGPRGHYPLYYFVPSHTADGRYLVVHEENDGEVQLQRLDLESGARETFTAGNTPEAGWAIWCVPATRGIYNHLSALNTATGDCFWFQDAAGQPGTLSLHAGHVPSLRTRRVLELPGRIPIGQSACSPEGRHFAFIHADYDSFRAGLAQREQLGHEVWRRQTPCVIGLVDTATGSYRKVIALDYHVHHVIFADDEHLLINHLPDGNGIWTIRLDGARESIRVLREPNAQGRVCHQVVTAKGIYYEAFATFTGAHESLAGWCDFTSGRFEERPLPATGYAHTGFDPAGEMLFYEVSGEVHALYAWLFPKDPERREFRLLRRLPPYPRRGQMYHAHPFLGPERRWLYYTEVVDGTPQVRALDVSDLADRSDCWWR
jgi:catechol 2,3-dioxygenase-like lactoylglutathione lyase family enzyme